MSSAFPSPRFAVLLGASFLFAASAWAEETIATWTTFGLTSGGAGDLAPNFTHEDIAVGSLTRAAGFPHNGGQNARWQGFPVEVYSSLAAAITAENFFTVTLAPEGEETLTIERLTVGFAGVSATNGVNTAQWQYSIDGGAYANFGSSIKSLSSNGTFLEVDGADFDVVAGSTVTFRMVAWAADGTSINARWGVRDVSGNPTVAFYGTVSAVPEPASAAALLGGAAFVLVGMRRRRAVRG